MKYIVPTPDIELYADGFETLKDGRKLDLLGRAAKGKQLSDLVERIEDPLVVAVDGRWGSGKSFFLKCWVGAHQKENGGKARTVYYDAFKHDYLDDPLISLTATIVERLEGTGERVSKIKKIKKAAGRLARPVARIGLAAASAGVSEVTGAVFDETIAATRSEISAEVDALWAREAGRRAAMEDFRKALISLTGPQDAPRKLVVVIDELDRCRPDHALCVLEVIKHFFDVPHVHFVLGVNLVELANCVRARYGAETDAGQ